VVPKLERRRYLALRVESEQPFSGSTVMDAVVASVQKLFGEYGGSQANVKLIKHIPQKSQLIIRCSHSSLEKVRAAAALITEIDQKPATIHVINVSGTLKALSKKT
jgi:ribonuclease P/MRP protein subunit POP5